MLQYKAKDKPLRRRISLVDAITAVAASCDIVSRCGRCLLPTTMKYKSMLLPKDPLLALPTELVCQILEYLDVSDLLACSLVRGPLRLLQLPPCL